MNLQSPPPCQILSGSVHHILLLHRSQFWLILEYLMVRFTNQDDSWHVMVLLLSPHVMRGHIVCCMFFVWSCRHAGNKIDSLAADISQEGSSERDEMLQIARWGGWSTPPPRPVTFDFIIIIIPWGAKIFKGKKIFVTLFSKVVSLISMKFGIIGGFSW